MKRVPPIMRKHWGKAITLLALAGALGAVWWALPVRPRLAWALPSKSEIAGFSLDGRTLVTCAVEADDDTALRFWDVATGRERAALGRKAAAVFLWRGNQLSHIWYPPPIWLSPNGSIAVCQGDNRRLRIVNVTTGELLDDPVFWEPWGHTRSPDCCFSPDAKTLAFHRSPSWLAGDERPAAICLWDVASRRIRATIPCGDAMQFAFSPDSRLIASVSCEDNAKPPGSTHPKEFVVSDTATGLEQARFEIRGRADISILAFSTNSATLTAAFCDYLDDSRPHRPLEVIQWDLARRTVVSHREANEFVISARDGIPPDHRYSYVASETTARIFDLVTGDERCALKDFGTDEDHVHDRLGLPPTHNAETSPDGRMLAAQVTRSPRKGGWQEWIAKVKAYVGLEAKAGENSVALWDLGTGRHLVTIASHKDYTFSSDGRLLAVRSGDHTITIWDLPPRKPLGWFLAIAAVVLALPAALWWRSRRRAKTA